MERKRKKEKTSSHVHGPVHAEDPSKRGMVITASRPGPQPPIKKPPSTVKRKVVYLGFQINPRNICPGCYVLDNGDLYPRFPATSTKRFG